MKIIKAKKRFATTALAFVTAFVIGSSVLAVESMTADEITDLVIEDYGGNVTGTTLHNKVENEDWDFDVWEVQITDEEGKEQVLCFNAKTGDELENAFCPIEESGEDH